MKETGIIRRVDDLGRVVIPRDIRRFLRLNEGDPMEILVDKGSVTFRRYNPLKINKAQSFQTAPCCIHRLFAIGRFLMVIRK